ncbi:MAG TPA: hypothetical protein VFD85_13010, partial [Gemmatimonadales bacterium]|nr:hypothetical protein [Gemmatimonadales bacterium]
VSRVYDESDFEEQVGDLLRTIADSSSTALAFTKRQFYQLDGVPFEAGIALSADVNAASRATADFRASIARFLKK